jgi:hypothetical protein
MSIAASSSPLSLSICISSVALFFAFPFPFPFDFVVAFAFSAGALLSLELSPFARGARVRGANFPVTLSICCGFSSCAAVAAPETSVASPPSAPRSFHLSEASLGCRLTSLKQIRCSVLETCTTERLFQS